MVRSFLVSAILALAGLAAPAAAEPVASSYTLDIPREPLDGALRDLAQQTGLQIARFNGSNRGTTPVGPVRGNMPVQNALKSLLAPTGLTYRMVNERTIAIVPLELHGDPATTNTTAETSAISTAHRAQEEGKSASSAGFPVAPVASGTAMQATVDKSKSSAAKTTGALLQEITVTGTYVPNVAPITPVVTLTQAQLIQQGYTRLDTAIQQLPQNFMGGGTSQTSNDVNGAGPLAAYNATFSSGVNLRGLGPGTTLVLLNGMRMAPTSSGFSTDISQIPLSIVRRVEVVPDGNSALYGSDAVGGVVNIITVKDFSGIESGVRVSDVASGMQPNEGGYLLGGSDWGTGNLMADFDFEQDHPLYARNRSFSSGAPDPTTLLIEQTTPSAYVSLRQRFANRWSLSAFGLWSRRRFESPDLTSTAFTLSSGEAGQASGALQAEYAISRGWSATMSAEYSREADDYSIDYYAPVSMISAAEDVLRESSGEFRVNGRVLELRGGPLSMALGGVHRRESFVSTDVVGHEASRRVDSAYGELMLPIVGPSNSLPLITGLRFDLAGRYDHYSDFGSSANPKVSLEWSPTGSLAVSATYGRSFRAPTLYSLDPAEIANAYVIDAPDPSSATGTSRVLDLDGTNRNLTPERAKTLDVALTYRLPLSRAFARVSYFDIEYDHRITRLITDGYFFNVLLQASALGPLLERNPAFAEVASALAGRNVISFVGPWTPQSIQAIANIGFENVASLGVRGFDMDFTYDDIETAVGRFRLSVAGTYNATYRQKLAPGAVWTSLQNTALNPLRLRALGNIGWSRNGWGANVRLNYANAYRNPTDLSCGALVGCPVSSWTTVDAALTYSLPPESPVLGGLRVNLSVSNLLDRNPPYVVETRAPGVNYDPTNASPLGRAFALMLSKKWGRD